MSEAFEDKLAGLKRRFAERSRGDLPIVEAAAADPAAVDPERLRLCVHKMAGAAGTFGYPELSAAAGEADDELVLGRYPPRVMLERVARLVRDLPA